MQMGELIYFVCENGAARDVVQYLNSPGINCRRFENGAAALRMARQELPRIVICSLRRGDAGTFCGRLKSDPLLRHCWLMLAYETGAVPAWAAQEETGPDDILPRNSSGPEVLYRLKIGLKMSRLVESNQRLQHEVDKLRLERQRDSLLANDTATQLVEIAAELSGEISRSAEMEQQHIQTAKSDTIAQAAAALRHEINNPLFAITGSAEAAVRRLDNLAEQIPADLSGIYGCLDRIQRGATRIQQVVRAITDLLMPTTTDYVPGVEMLDLRRTE
jgi:signal transduction histidine kinase